MLRTLFDRDDLAPRERLAALNDAFLTSEHAMGVLSLSPAADDFTALVRGADLAAVSVAELTMSPGRVVRSARMVRQTDPELVCVALAPSGVTVLSQAGREAVLGPNDLAFYDSSSPFEIRIGAPGGEPATLIRAHVPRALLGPSADLVEPLLARRLPGSGGFAGMFVHLMSSLADESRAYRPNDRSRLSEIAGDVLTALVDHHADAEPVPGDDSRKGALLLSIEAFVQQHLNDPDLSPRTIAGAHHLSVGYLHRLFSARGTTLTAWIRGMRLKRACRDLRDPALSEVTVHQIAVRWGFRDHSTFTRSFRTAYGMSPRDYRHASSSQW
ncbi:helix-turn-helix domain-containing protein [Streptomyces sp. SID2563]|uniref:helix-turn-helix domain-containing protein n=1 Tax=Streptomyces sp. SID2563 TaxID=2690255 RepID=UPI001369362C|nr:helix-turn-helix domain-containing protein [Streptomyces sp. SID2563]MYW06815.1 helix-turn-helix domain-containing protein [Streptomyces sp. SID2563]